MLYAGLLFSLFPIIYSQNYDKIVDITGNEIDTDLMLDRNVGNEDIFDISIKSRDFDKEETKSVGNEDIFNISIKSRDFDKEETKSVGNEDIFNISIKSRDFDKEETKSVGNEGIFNISIKTRDFDEEETKKSTSNIEDKTVYPTYRNVENVNDHTTKDAKTYAIHRISYETTTDQSIMVEEDSDDISLFALIGDTVVSSLNFIWGRVKKIFHWAWGGGSFFSF